MKYSKSMIYEEGYLPVNGAVEAFESPNRLGSSVPVAPQTENIGNDHTVTAESDSSLSKEQQEKVDQWMKEVKAFIRKIDVNSL